MLPYTVKMILIIILELGRSDSLLYSKEMWRKNTLGQLMIFFSPLFPRRSHLHNSSDCLFIQQKVISEQVDFHILDTGTLRTF